MKKIYLIILVFFCSLASHGQVAKYASFEADITNTNDPIYISTKDKVIKKLEKNSNGIRSMPHKEVINCLTEKIHS